MDVTIIKPFTHKNLIDKEQEVVDLYYDEFAPMLYIADTYRCSCDTITKWFKANNLKTRTIEESKITKGKFRVKNNAIFGDFKFTHPKLLGKDEEIRKLYVDDGWGTSEICGLFDVQSMTIATWLKRNGVHIRNAKEARNIERRYEKQKTQVQRNVPDEEVKNICDLYNEGYGAKYIAKLLKYDSCVIFRILGEQGIHIRNQKEAANSEKSREMSANTYIEKYGNFDIINKKRRDTMFEKYGGYKLQTINREQIMMEKYGVKNPMQVHDYFYKNHESGLRFNTAIIEGVEIKYQGYELKGIYRLLSEGYSMSDINIGRAVVPTFRYCLSGKRRVYYPDIYIPKDNRIVEVKSVYTYEKELEKNLLKRQAVIDAGYLFDFYIMEK